MLGGTFYILSDSDAATRYKRYIVSAKLWFGKTLTLPVFGIKITAPAPPQNRLRLFNSFTELAGGLNVDGSQEYIDVKKNPVVGNIILEAITVSDLMEFEGNIYDYLQRNSFNCSLIRNGQRKYFRYEPKEMLMYVEYAENKKTYAVLKANATLENSCNEFADMAKENAIALAEVCKNFNQYPEDLKKKIRLAIIKHKNIINEFKSNAPAGFYIKTAEIPIKNLQNGSVGIVPIVIYIVVAIITAGVVIAVDLISKKLADVAKQKNQLKANADAVEQIRIAAEEYQQGKISQEGYKNVVTAAGKNIDAGNKRLDEQSRADAADKASGGILGEVKQILFVGAAVYMAKLIFSGNNNSSK